MPLSFQSLSHGEVAFGFFNIETDLLLLQHYFFFASDFCRQVSRMAEGSQDQRQEPWKFFLLSREKMGNLPGAIQGRDLRGFIGATYQRFPFPKDPKDFRQNPDGYKRRATIEALLLAYSQPSTILIRVDTGEQTVQIGEFIFSREVWAALLDYVWLGGYPRWQAGIRPEYVQAMKEAVERSKHPLLEGIVF